MTKSRPRKILYVVTEDWYFCSHRLPVARAAREAGYEVVVATRVERHGKQILGEGFRLLPIKLRRRGMNPLTELAAILELARIYRREKPDLVHQVALKPVLYGSLGAALAGVPIRINALAGLGFVFVSGGIMAKLLRIVVRLCLRLALTRGNTEVIVQNRDDGELMGSLGVASARINLIRGSGIDLQQFTPMPEPDGPVVVTFVSRMLWDKGVGELVEAAGMLRVRYPALVVRLVGMPDPDNPASIPRRQLEHWNKQGLIEWLGYSDDIPGVWADSHIAVLPSYREGLPKCLLEAASCGRPMVATDVAGCRELVAHGIDGLLVPARDSSALAEAIAQLVCDAGLRRRMGRLAREKVERGFAQELVSAQTLDLYRRALSV